MSGWCVCSLCAVVLIPYRTIVELLIEHFEFGWRKPARGEKSILYSQVSDKHVVLPSRVGDNKSALNESCGPICSPTLSLAFTSENFTNEKTNLARDRSPEARKKSKKVLFSLKMRMFFNDSILKC